MSNPASDSRTSAPMIRESRMFPTRSYAGSSQSTQCSCTRTHFEAEMRGDGCDLARVVRLDAADRDERVAALRERVGGEVLELARLVAAVREAGVAVVALGPDLDLAAEVLAQPVEAMHRRRPEDERDTRERVGGHYAPLSGTSPFVEPARSITTCGTRARGERRSSMRTTSAQSSGWIISSSPRPDHCAIGVATKPGQMATARTPSLSSSSLSERVNEITAAFVAP